MRCSCGTETVKRANWRGRLCDYCPKCKKFVSWATIMIIKSKPMIGETKHDN